MAFQPLPLFLLSLLISATSISANESLSVSAYPPAQAPHHHHHHHHHHSPTPAPAHSPTKPPTHPPVKPPTKPPTYPPVKPPTKPPTPPPVKPPTKPPTTPPVKPPTKPPTTPPVKPPTKPPTTPPVKPPTYPPQRKMVAIQGVVYCKSCKYRGIDTLMHAAPLAGASVKLQCNNTKKGLVEQGKTDKNGYFIFMPKLLTTSGSHKCKVFLVSSPVANCTVPTNLHSGTAGAILIPSTKPSPTPKLAIFTVGPFAFEPQKKQPCY